MKKLPNTKPHPRSGQWLYVVLARIKFTDSLTKVIGLELLVDCVNNAKHGFDKWWTPDRGDDKYYVRRYPFICTKDNNKYTLVLRIRRLDKGDIYASLAGERAKYI